MKTSNHYNIIMHIFQRISPKLAVVLAALGLFIAVVVLTGARMPPAKGLPEELKINWTPASVTTTIIAGESQTIPVSFTVPRTLNDVAVQIPPELAPYVQVEPQYFERIRQGKTVNLNLTVATPIDVLPEVIQGDIKLIHEKNLSNNTVSKSVLFANSLPVTINVVWQQFRNNELGVNIDYPSTFERIDSGNAAQPLAVGGSHTLAILRTISLEGKPATDVPAVGCSVYIGIEDNSTGLPLSEWLLTQSYRRLEDIDEVIEIDGKSSVRRTGVGEIFGEPFTVVFVPHNTVIYTLTLNAYGDSATIEQCDSDFDLMLGSFHING